MNIKTLLATGLLACGLVVSSVSAATISYLGSELVGVANFPTDQPQVSGTSLLFGQTSDSTIHKLIDLPLSPPPGTTDIVVRVGLTHPAGANPEYDFLTGLSDGQNVVTLNAGDNEGGVLRLLQGYEIGNIIGWSSLEPLYPWPKPAQGVPYEAVMNYNIASGTTTLTGELLGTSVTTAFTVGLNLANLHFVYYRDNETFEQHQFDWVSIEYAGASTPVAADIKPGSCPNPLNAESANGVVSVAINGDATINITDIDPASVRLAGVAPLRWNYEDVSAPYTPYIGKTNRLDCHAAGDDDTLRDGLLDLVFKFDTASLITALGGSNLANGATVVVPLTGTLLDGTPIVGEDVVWIRTGDNDD
ncbi:MAG: hypothetical protein ACOY4U_07130 [Pseudomonadota bacterium]